MTAWDSSDRNRLRKSGWAATSHGRTGEAGYDLTMADPRPISILTCANCGAKNRIGPSERGAPHCGKCGKPLAWVVDANESTFEVET